MFLETSVSLCIKLTVLLSSEYLSGYANAIVRNRSRPHSVSVRSVISLSLSLSLSLSRSLFVPLRIRRHRFTARQSDPVLSQDRN